MRRLPFFLAVLLFACPVAADEHESQWEALRAARQRVGWTAEGLTPAPQIAETFTAPMGYRVERYLWKAQKPAGAFALAVLRDLSDDDHYLSGPVDLMKFATTVLKGLEAPTPRALEQSDIRVATGNGPVLTRRFELGLRQCLVLGFYAEPQGKQDGPVAAKEEPLAEGSLRLDGVYCATAGQPLTPQQVLAYAAGMKLRPAKN
ncbi:hypothetical protein [Ferrovibrio sp.]|uniref:hypothetical protein n=1 Tax=Ferrovibrio sp. TaxID=1917215 RepID=UPI00261DA0B9|nr:hypothetical protein [Ferrovibrio sp.]